MEIKICSICNVEKPLSGYYSNYRGKPFTYCRSCHRAKVAQWRKENPHATKEAQRRNTKKNGRKFYLNQVEVRKKNWVKYSLQRKQWDGNRKKDRYELAWKLEVAQDKKCAICKISFVERYDIDHSHITGLVRGLLCRKCNSGLHYFEDPEFIKKATEYVRKYPASDFPPTKY